MFTLGNVDFLESMVETLEKQFQNAKSEKARAKIGKRLARMRSNLPKKTSFGFDELNEDSKEKARNWFRDMDGMEFDDIHGQFIVDDAKECLAMLGIDVESVYYSGFGNQGDGACFEGSYSYRKGWKKELINHIGGDDLKELERIGNELQAIQSRAFYKLRASITHKGRYYHEQSFGIDADTCDESRYASDEEEEGIADLLSECMQWIYGKLENEFEYRTSDEAVYENIIANGYNFDENGNIKD